MHGRAAQHRADECILLSSCAALPPAFGVASAMQNGQNHDGAPIENRKIDDAVGASPDQSAVGTVVGTAVAQGTGLRVGVDAMKRPAHLVQNKTTQPLFLSRPPPGSRPDRPSRRISIAAAPRVAATGSCRPDKGIRALGSGADDAADTPPPDHPDGMADQGATPEPRQRLIEAGVPYLQQRDPPPSTSSLPCSRAIRAPWPRRSPPRPRRTIGLSGQRQWLRVAVH